MFCAYRMGGAAIMMSNRADLAGRARYQLEHSTRVHTASDDGAYACMSWGPDKVCVCVSVRVCVCSCFKYRMACLHGTSTTFQ
jgi:hypothetical protein